MEISTPQQRRLPLRSVYKENYQCPQQRIYSNIQATNLADANTRLVAPADRRLLPTRYEDIVRHSISARHGLAACDGRTDHRVERIPDAMPAWKLAGQRMASAN